MASSSSPIKPPNGIAKNGDHDNNDITAPQSESEHSIKGILLIMIGSFSFSIMFLLVKIMTDMNTFTLVFYRSIVQIGISLIDLYKKGTNPLGPNDARVRFYLVLRAVFGAGAVMAWFFGIQILPLPDAVTLQFTTPPFAAAFAVCMVGERWKRLDVVGAVVCLSGVALIAHPTWLFGSAISEEEIIEDNDDNDDSIVSPTLKAAAVMVTTAGAAMAGCAYVCVRKIGDAADAVVMVFYYGVLSLPMAAVGSKLYVGTWNVLGDIQHFRFIDYFLLLLVGFAGYGGQWFTNLGLQNETAATATLATSTQIVWTFVFEILFLHEALNVWSLAGTTLILGYMMMVGVLKVMESSGRQHYGADVEEGAVDEEGDLLLEPPHSAGGSASPKKNGYGAIQGSPATSVASRSSRRERYGAAHVLQWQGSNSW